MHTEFLEESDFKQPEDCNLCLWCPPGAPVRSLDGLHQTGPRTKCVLLSHHTLLKACWSVFPLLFPHILIRRWVSRSSLLPPKHWFPFLSLHSALGKCCLVPSFPSSLIPWLHMLVPKILHPAFLMLLLKESILTFPSKKLGRWKLSYSVGDWCRVFGSIWENSISSFCSK